MWCLRFRRKILDLGLVIFNAARIMKARDLLCKKTAFIRRLFIPHCTFWRQQLWTGQGKFFNQVILLFFLFYLFLHTCCTHLTFFCQNEQSLLTYDGAKGIGNPFKELKTSSSSAGRNKMRRQLQSWVMYSKISVGAFKILRWTRRLWSPFRFVNVVGCQLECWAGKRFRYLYSSVHDEKYETTIRAPNPSISR